MSSSSSRGNLSARRTPGLRATHRRARASKHLVAAFLLLLSSLVTAQTDSITLPEAQILDIQTLVREALQKNPGIQASGFRMAEEDARVPQASALEDPRFTFTQEGMPDFRYNDAMFTRLELMQMFPFPGKLSSRSKIASLRSDHAHHDHFETINGVLTSLKQAYFDLWFSQQAIILQREGIRLLGQIHAAAMTNYASGNATQAEVLSLGVELSLAGNELLRLRADELGAKAMLMSILDRSPADTLGYALIPEEIGHQPDLDSLIAIALAHRPMIIHDSLMVTENELILTLARQEYFPDVSLAVERMISPSDDFRGWSIRAGITIPFSPWTLGKASGRVSEAEAAVHRTEASYRNTRAMIIGSIRDLWYRTSAERNQLVTYQKSILPQAKQALESSMGAYQSGNPVFSVLLSTYRSYLEIMKEYFMTRKDLGRMDADLEKESGVLFREESEN